MGLIVFGATPSRFGIFLALLPLYYVAWSAGGVGLSHDDGIYIVTAKALATGQGYSIISLPNEIKQTKYPILFPFLLSLLWRVNPDFPANIPWLKLLPLLSTVAWALGVYRLSRELQMSKLWALCITALVAGNPWVVSFSGSLRPENLFAALTTWAVVLLCRAERSGRLRPAMCAAVLLCAAYHTRTAAIAVIAGGILGLVIARRFRLALLTLGLTALLCLPWILWQAQQSILPPVELYYSALCYKQENILTYFSLGEKTAILGQNLIQTLSAPAVLFGFPNMWAGLAASVLFWSIFAVGLVRTSSRCLQVAAVFSVLMPSLWSWTPSRFLFPAAGFILLATYNAFRQQTARYLMLTLLLVPLSTSRWSLEREWQRTQLYSIVFKSYPATWEQMQNIERWVHANASAGDVVISSMDPFVYLYTDLKSIRGFYPDALPVYYDLPSNVDSEREFLRVLATYRPKYCIRIRNDFYESKFLGRVTDRLIEKGCITEVHGAGSLQVYEVQQPPCALTASSSHV